VERRLGRHLDAAEVEDCRHEVGVGGQGRDVAPAPCALGGAVHEERHAMPALVLPALHAPHARVEVTGALLDMAVGVARHAAAGAVVRHEYKDGVVGDPQLLEPGPEPSDVLVDVRHGAVEPRALLAGRDVQIHILVLVLDIPRPVGRVARDVAEEALVLVFLDKLHALGEEDVTAEALELLELAVHRVGVVEVVVAPVVGGVADAAAPVRDGVLEAALVRAEGLGVAEVPLAEVPGPVAGLLERVGERPLVFPEQRPPSNSMPDAGAVAVMAGEQPRARRRACGAHVEVSEPHALGMQLVEVRRLDPFIPVRPDLTVALVVGEDENHVWSIHVQV